MAQAGVIGADFEKGSAIATLFFAIKGLRNCRLERNHAVDAVCPENAEFALVVTTKVDETAAALAGAGQGYLVNRPNAELVLVLDQDQGLARHRSGKAKIRELDDLAGDRLAGGSNGGLGLRIHFTIEAEALYPLK
jgi:hypothetical protein